MKLHLHIHLFLAAVCLLSIVITGCASTMKPTTASSSTTREGDITEVTAAEIGFAETMAKRDHAAFLEFISEEAVFLNGGKPLRGKAEIGAYWKRFYTSKDAPFSWKPDLVEVLPSGNLAQSVGPVTGANGKIIARFYSTWRREADGKWRVIFDDGYDVCAPAKP